MGASDIRNAIQTLSGFNDLGFEAVACKASNIDLVAMTCTCAPINGDADFFNVRINADAKNGFVLVPEDNSIVIVQQTSDATAYVGMVSDVQGIYLAGDANGGLVKVQVLNAALNNLQTEINTLKIAITALMAGYAPIDGGAALGVFTALVLPQINISQIENTKVKHGNG